MHEKLGHQLPASDDFCQCGCIFEGAGLWTKKFNFLSLLSVLPGNMIFIWNDALPINGLSLVYKLDRNCFLLYVLEHLCSRSTMLASLLGQGLAWVEQLLPELSGFYLLEHLPRPPACPSPKSWAAGSWVHHLTYFRIDASQFFTTTFPKWPWPYPPWTSCLGTCGQTWSHPPWPSSRWLYCRQCHSKSDIDDWSSSACNKGGFHWVLITTRLFLRMNFSMLGT